MDAVAWLLGGLAGAALLRRGRRGGRMPDSGTVVSLAPRLEVHGRWSWVTAAAPSLGVVLGGTAEEAMAATGARWVACGPMFDREGPEYLLKDSVTGVDLPSRQPRRGATICVG